MRRTNPVALLVVAMALLVGSFQLWVSTSNPPGFHHDEAAFALNAYTLAHGLRGQDGALLPIVLPSFGDYKMATFSYVLAPAFAIFGPHVWLARAVAALFGLAAVVLVALIAYRRGGLRVAVIAGVLAGLTPWIFQLGRVAYDTSMFPFATALVLLAVDIWYRGRRHILLHSVFVGVALGFMTYAYGAGRLLGPALAVALVVFVGRVRFAAIGTAWATFAVLLAPLAAYRVRHPHGLTARYEHTTFVAHGMSWWTIGRHAASNWAHDMNPWHWVVSGDRKPYVDVWGAPQLLAIVVLLAVLGVTAIVRRRGDRWWLYVLVVTALAGVPASLTADRHDALRLSAVPVCACVLAIAGLSELCRIRPPYAIVALSLVVALGIGEWAWFVQLYSNRGRPQKLIAFEAGVPDLVRRGLAGGKTIYVDYDDPYALTMSQWYAVSAGLPRSRVVRLPDGGIPPTGSSVLGRTQPCDYTCIQVGESDGFWLARAEPSS